MPRTGNGSQQALVGVTMVGLGLLMIAGSAARRPRT
jgi:hypothetical protein